jgi:hypothetical protein
MVHRYNMDYTSSFDKAAKFANELYIENPDIEPEKLITDAPSNGDANLNARFLSSANASSWSGSS